MPSRSLHPPATSSYAADWAYSGGGGRAQGMHAAGGVPLAPRSPDPNNSDTDDDEYVPGTPND